MNSGANYTESAGKMQAPEMVEKSRIFLGRESLQLLSKTVIILKKGERG
jgi:hypothetical protein